MAPSNPLVSPSLPPSLPSSLLVSDPLSLQSLPPSLFSSSFFISHSLHPAQPSTSVPNEHPPNPPPSTILPPTNSPPPLSRRARTHSRQRPTSPPLPSTTTTDRGTSREVDTLLLSLWITRFPPTWGVMERTEEEGMEVTFKEPRLRGLRRRTARGRGR